MRRWLHEPLFWILLAAAALRLTGLFWGLPGSDGWDDDGFAPRNFLTALALTWKPGAYFTYPPLHALLLALPSLPVAAWALAHAPSLSQHDVITTITQPQYMTYFSVVARLVSISMSVGIIWTVGAMAQVMAGRRAGLFAAGAAALNVGLTYYGQVSNLDVAYLFWTMLSLLFCMRAVVGKKPNRFWYAALFAAAAVATKDQAYAVFALSLPMFFALWFGTDPWPRRNARSLLVTLALAAIAAIVALLLVDGAITNPGGFLKRVAFLAGPASQDYAEYPHGMAGARVLLGDMFSHYTEGVGAVTFALAVIGAAAFVLRARGALWIAGMLPLLAAISFTLCFNLAALRSDDRFVLPQALMACVYIGIAAALVLNARPRLRPVAVAVLAVTGLLSLHQAMAVDAAMLLDPRYDAERWMAAHVRTGDTIETYGQNAYLPRFPARAAITRIAQTPLAPLPGVTERRGNFGAPTARYMVVSDWWQRHYTSPQSELGGGRMPSPKQQAQFGDAQARAYFTMLRLGRLNYRLVHVSAPATAPWPELHIHESLNETILIFERIS
jgi:4-amino-4-deoxy-L-arabinose transferase-like glycosyltransferase